MLRRRLTLPPTVPDLAARLELLRAGDRFWSPAPLELLRQVRRPILAWLGAAGWFEWQQRPDGPLRRVVRALLYSHVPWPTSQTLAHPASALAFQGEPARDLGPATAACRQALARWASRLPLKTVPDWMFDIAIHTTLHYGFTNRWEWTFQMPDLRLLPPVLGWQPDETEAQFRRRALRDFESLLSEHIRNVRHAYGLGLRKNSTRQETLVRHASWLARFLSGTPAFRMDPDYDEDAVLRAIHRFCSRIGLDLASVRLPVTRRPAQEGERCQAAGSLTLGDSLGTRTGKRGENPAKAGANSSGVNLRQIKPIRWTFKTLQ